MTDPKPKRGAGKPRAAAPSRDTATARDGDAPPRPPRRPAKPLWREFFDAVEGQLGPQLEALTRRGEFAAFLAATTRAEARFRRELDRRMGAYWHFWNLPAYSDVRQTVERLGALERRLRDLAEREEERT